MVGAHPKLTRGNSDGERARHGVRPSGASDRNENERRRREERGRYGGGGENNKASLIQDYECDR